ncbi:unnamed protein product [Rotaria magnacalcarata]
MTNTTSLIDKESLKNLDASQAYADNDGVFDCILNKYDNDNQLMTYRMHILLLNEARQYYLLLHKPDGQSIIETADSNIDLVKSKFYSLFNELTGNYWSLREKFVKTPDHYVYTIPADLNSSPSSEEQQVNINQINNIPKFICSERAFFNTKANALDQTYKYVHDGITWRIPLPDISSEIITCSLLSLRSLIVRIGILYLHQSTTRMLFGSGLLLNNQIVLTCAHNFDPINWGGEMIPLRKIYVSSSDPASPDLLSGIDPNSSVIEAQIIQRGLKDDNISNLDELKSNTADIALLKLNHPAPHLQFDSFFDPKFSSSSDVAPVNCKLFLAGYNGQLYDSNDLNAYKYTNGFELVTIDKLNYLHNVNNKSISIGYLIQESSSNSCYGMHNCSTLAGSSGAVIVDSIGRFIGIHIGIANSRISRKNEIVYTQDTFNKFIHVRSTAFNTFIDEAIIPNISDDQLKQKWKFI